MEKNLKQDELTQRISFASKDSFRTWLQYNTRYVIKFIDFTQDLTCIYLDSEGYIIHCNLQARVWNGCQVDLDSIQIGSCINFLDKQDLPIRMNFIISRIDRIDQIKKTAV